MTTTNEEAPSVFAAGSTAIFQAVNVGEVGTVKFRVQEQIGSGDWDQPSDYSVSNNPYELRLQVTASWLQDDWKIRIRVKRESDWSNSWADSLEFVFPN